MRTPTRGDCNDEPPRPDIRIDVFSGDDQLRRQGRSLRLGDADRERVRHHAGSTWLSFFVLPLALCDLPRSHGHDRRQIRQERLG